MGKEKKTKKTFQSAGKITRVVSPLNKDHKTLSSLQIKEKTGIFNKLERAFTFLKEKISKFLEKKRPKLTKVNRGIFVRKLVIIIAWLVIFTAIGLAVVYQSLQDWKDEKIILDPELGTYEVKGWFYDKIFDKYFITVKDKWWLFERVIHFVVPSMLIEMPTKEETNPQNYILVIAEKNGKKTYELKKLENK